MPWNLDKFESTTCLREPTRDQWLKIVQYDEVTNFPNCVGALVGKGIRVAKPAHSRSLFYNYKHYFAFILIGSTSTDYKFTFIDVGAFGNSPIIQFSITVLQQTSE